MKIKRRIKTNVNAMYKEVTESVELIREGKRFVWVKLSNGDIIKRKVKDIVER